MPTPTEILGGLTRIANDGWFLAMTWHALVSVAFVAIASGSRPSGRAAGLASSTLPFSVSALAWAYGNPFNGAVFALLGASFAAIALRAPSDPITIRSGWERWLGIALASFGWLYPHFLDATPTAYLVAAPLGLVPCPTLSMMLGLALLGLRPAGSGWSWLLVLTASFYAIVGAFRLGVFIDLAMIAGALGLALATWRGGHLGPLDATPRAA